MALSRTSQGRRGDYDMMDRAKDVGSDVEHDHGALALYIASGRRHADCRLLMSLGSIVTAGVCIRFGGNTLMSALLTYSCSHRQQSL